MKNYLVSCHILCNTYVSMHVYKVIPPIQLEQYNEGINQAWFILYHNIFLKKPFYNDCIWKLKF